MMRDIAASSIRMYGDDHPPLAQFLCYSGKLTESLQLDKRAWEGFRSSKSHGANHQDSLLALRHLGVVQARFFRYDELLELCEQVLEGLSHCNDVEDETLFTKEDIASALAGAKHNPDRARALMGEVSGKKEGHLG